MTEIKIENYSSILFDLDGTILNSEPIHMSALSKLLGAENINASTDELNDDYHGLDDTAVFNNLKQKHPTLSLSKDDFLKKKNILYISELTELNDEKLEELITPGFRAFLGKITPAHKVGVVSASEKEVVLSTLERLKIRNNMSIIEFRKDDTESKPSPFPYLNTMKELGSTPERTLIFEDSETGMAAAASSGATVIQIECFATKTIGTRKIRDFNHLK
jgi:HAD superfamily hydrolase (TIGR01509 family)